MNDTLKKNYKRIEFAKKSFEEYVRTVTNSYLIVLYDEVEMNLRIG
jgi:hypothetical protein